MILIIGGAYQGKAAYAGERYPGKPVLYNFHLKVLEKLEAGEEILPWVQAQLPLWRDSVIICDDISCGVVPMEPLNRKWREETGRALTLLSQTAGEVVRVFCGLGTKLK